jgi:hypothetical protein
VLCIVLFALANAPVAAADRGQAETQLSPGGQTRIVGGYDAYDDYPWMVSLQLEGRGLGAHECGGTLVAPTWVLTAAHCARDGAAVFPSSWHAVIGTLDLNGDEGRAIGVERIVGHPSYDPYTNRHDIALFKLDRAVTDVPFVPLARNGDERLTEPGTWQMIIGWGRLGENAAAGPRLQEAHIEAMDGSACAGADTFDYVGYDDALMICAGLPEGGVDSCRGDSGGPLFTFDGANALQTGVVSYGRGCARAGYPGVYTRVAAEWDWLRSVIGGRPLDLVFAIDATGSMADDIDAVRDASRALSAIYGLVFDLRTSVVTYKDHPDAGGAWGDYPQRLELELTPDFRGFRETLDGVSVYGGGDTPESVYSGMMTAIQRPWRTNARRAVLLFGDAPPKDPEPITGLTHDDVVRAARGGGATRSVRSAIGDPRAVSVFGLTVGGDTAAQHAFARLAADTGGAAFAAEDAGAVTGEMSSLLGALAAEPIAVAGGPYAGVIGQPVTFSGSGRDDDGTIVDYAWDIDGDGIADAHGASASWTFTRPGPAQRVMLTVTDDDGLVGVAQTTVDVAPAPVAPPPVAAAARPRDRTAPRLRGLRLSRRTLRVGVSEAGSVAVRIERCRRRARAGRRTPGRGKARVCTVVRRHSARARRAGVVRIAVGALRPGRYRVVATARDRAGNRSKPLVASVEVRRAVTRRGRR